jgi:hypothetical protein
LISASSLVPLSQKAGRHQKKPATGIQHRVLSRSILRHSDQRIWRPRPRWGQHGFSTGPETTGNNWHQSGKPDMRTARPTRRRTARSATRSFGETAGQPPSIATSGAGGP